jgi:hypothetical protein
MVVMAHMAHMTHVFWGYTHIRADTCGYAPMRMRAGIARGYPPKDVGHVGHRHEAFTR